MTRGRVIIIAAAASVVVLLGAGIVVWQLVLPRTVSIVANGAEIRFPADAFGGDARPSVSSAPANDEFLSAFGLTSGGSGPLVTSVAGPAEPDEPFEVALDADLDALPAGAVPAVFVRDADAGLWLPLPTVVDGDRRVVGTADRLGEFAPAALTALQDQWEGGRWLSFQVGGNGNAQPECTNIPPPWLIDVAIDSESDAPLAACAESNAGGDLVIRIGAERPYPLVISPSTAPAAARWDAPDSTVAALAAAPSALRLSEAAVAPAGVETVLTWPAGSLPGGSTTIDVATPLQLGELLDTAVTGVGVAGDLIEDPEEPVTAALECIERAADDAYTAGRLTPPIVEAAAACLDPLTDVGSPVAQRLVDGVRTALLLAGENPQQQELAATEPAAGVVLSLAEILDPPPEGGTVLADALTAAAGAGPSGNLVSVIIDGRYADTSTTQWVGCDGVAAYAEYALGDHRHLAGLLGARDYMPPDLVAEVRVLVDGDVVAEYEVGHEAIPVDLALPAGEVLRIEAERTAGLCSTAPDAYLAFGNAALF